MNRNEEKQINMKTNTCPTPRALLQGSILPSTTEARSLRGNTRLRLGAIRRAGLAALVGCAAAFLPQPMFAQTWYTVDDFQYSPGTSSFATGLAKDPTGTIIYSAGYGLDASGLGHGLAFKSADGGTNWLLLDDYAANAFSGISTDPSANIYTAGDLFGLGEENWFTRRSVDGGATWSTVDTVPGWAEAHAYAVAADALGNVYVGGYVSTNHGFPRATWIVHKGIGGTNWATVATSGAESNIPPWSAYGVFCHPTAGVFVVGYGLGPAVQYKGRTVYPAAWVVRRSRDGGATWATVDSFLFVQKNVINNATAYSVGADSSGDVYVVGTAGSNEGNVQHWIVRRSTDGGNSWSTVDDFAPSAGAIPYPSPTPRALGSDANGNLFVAGTVRLGPSNATETKTVQWLVRESQGGTGSWQTVDTFQYVSGEDSQAYTLTCDSSGHTYVAGYGTDASGVSHWLVRKH